MPAPPTRSQQASMKTTTKSATTKSSNAGGSMSGVRQASAPKTSASPSRGNTGPSGNKSTNAGRTMSGVRSNTSNSTSPSSKIAGHTISGVRSGTTTQVNNSSKSSLLQKAIQRHAAHNPKSSTGYNPLNNMTQPKPVLRGVAGRGNNIMSERDINYFTQDRQGIPMGPAKPFMTDRLPGYTGATPPTPEFRPGPMAGKFQDRIAPSVNTAMQYPGVRSRSPGPSLGVGARQGIPTAPRAGPSYGRGGSMGLQPQNINAPLPDASTYGPETPAGPEGHQRGTNLNLGTTRSIAPSTGTAESKEYTPLFGGFRRGVARLKAAGQKVGNVLNKIDQGVKSFGVGATQSYVNSEVDKARGGQGTNSAYSRMAANSASNSGNGPRRKRIPVTSFAKGGAVEKFMARYPDFKLT